VAVTVMLSIVVPCYRSGAWLDELVDRPEDLPRLILARRARPDLDDVFARFHQKQHPALRRVANVEFDYAARPHGRSGYDVWSLIPLLFYNVTGVRRL
jgi:hypothetical protein